MRPLHIKLVLLSLLFASCFLRLNAKSIVVGDDLDKVEDNEEDDDWKTWGAKSRYDDPTKKAAAFAMIKLQYKAERSIDEIRVLADLWSQKLQTGSATVGFKPIDPNTLFINLRQDDELENVKQFVLEQPETYEIMIDGRTFRKEGDPSVEEAGADIEAQVKRRLKREKMMKKKLERQAKKKQKEDAARQAKIKPKTEGSTGREEL